MMFMKHENLNKTTVLVMFALTFRKSAVHNSLNHSLHSNRTELQTNLIHASVTARDLSRVPPSTVRTWQNTNTARNYKTDG